MPDGDFDFSSGERLRFDPQFNLRWFDGVQGFDKLYSALSEVFTPRADGTHIRPSVALDLIRETELEMAEEHNMTSEQTLHISHTAGKYAMRLPTELEIEISGLED